MLIESMLKPMRIPSSNQQLVPFPCLSSGYMGTPDVMGKLKNITDFDAEFFGVHSKSANTMDPMLRIMLEVVYEAIVDAGDQRVGKLSFKTAVISMRI